MAQEATTFRLPKENAEKKPSCNVVLKRFKTFCQSALANENRGDIHLESVLPTKQTDIQESNFTEVNDDYVLSAFSLVSDLKLCNRPRELFIVCSFLMHYSASNFESIYSTVNLENFASNVASEDKEKILSAISRAVEKQKGLTLTVTELGQLAVQSINEQSFSVSSVCQALSLSAKVIFYCYDIMLFIWELHSECPNIFQKTNHILFISTFFSAKKKKENTITASSNDSHKPEFHFFLEQCFNQLHEKNKKGNKFLESFLYFLTGFRHLFVFGLMPATSSVTASSQKASCFKMDAFQTLTVLFELSQLNKDETDEVENSKKSQDLLPTSPLILVQMWLYLEQLSTLNSNNTPHIFSSVLLPSFDLNVLSVLFRGWRDSYKQQETDSKWKQPTLILWQSWISCLHSSFLFFSTTCFLKNTHTVSRLSTLFEFISQVLHNLQPVKHYTQPLNTLCRCIFFQLNKKSSQQLPMFLITSLFHQSYKQFNLCNYSQSGVSVWISTILSILKDCCQLSSHISIYPNTIIYYSGIIYRLLTDWICHDNCCLYNTCHKDVSKDHYYNELHIYLLLILKLSDDLIKGFEGLITLNSSMVKQQLTSAHCLRVLMKQFTLDCTPDMSRLLKLFSQLSQYTFIYEYFLNQPLQLNELSEFELVLINCFTGRLRRRLMSLASVIRRWVVSVKKHIQSIQSIALERLPLINLNPPASHRTEQDLDHIIQEVCDIQSIHHLISIMDYYNELNHFNIFRVNTHSMYHTLWTSMMSKDNTTPINQERIRDSLYDPIEHMLSSCLQLISKCFTSLLTGNNFHDNQTNESYTTTFQINGIIPDFIESSMLSKIKDKKVTFSMTLYADCIYSIVIDYTHIFCLSHYIINLFYPILPNPIFPCCLSFLNTIYHISYNTLQQVLLYSTDPFKKDIILITQFKLSQCFYIAADICSSAAHHLSLLPIKTILFPIESIRLDIYNIFALQWALTFNTLHSSIDGHSVPQHQSYHLEEYHPVPCDSSPIEHLSIIGKTLLQHMIHPPETERILSPTMNNFYDSHSIHTPIKKSTPLLHQTTHHTPFLFPQLFQTDKIEYSHQDIRQLYSLLIDKLLRRGYRCLKSIYKLIQRWDAYNITFTHRISKHSADIIKHIIQLFLILSLHINWNLIDVLFSDHTKNTMISYVIYFILSTFQLIKHNTLPLLPLSLESVLHVSSDSMIPDPITPRRTPEKTFLLQPRLNDNDWTPPCQRHTTQLIHSSTILSSLSHLINSISHSLLKLFQWYSRTVIYLYCYASYTSTPEELSLLSGLIIQKQLTQEPKIHCDLIYFVYQSYLLILLESFQHEYLTILRKGTFQETSFYDSIQLVLYKPTFDAIQCFIKHIASTMENLTIMFCDIHTTPDSLLSTVTLYSQLMQLNILSGSFKQVSLYCEQSTHKINTESTQFTDTDHMISNTLSNSDNHATQKELQQSFKNIWIQHTHCIEQSIVSIQTNERVQHSYQLTCLILQSLLQLVETSFYYWDSISLPSVSNTCVQSLDKKHIPIAFHFLTIFHASYSNKHTSERQFFDAVLSESPQWLDQTIEPIEHLCSSLHSCQESVQFITKHFQLFYKIFIDDIFMMLFTVPSFHLDDPFPIFFLDIHEWMKCWDTTHINSTLQPRLSINYTIQLLHHLWFNLSMMLSTGKDIIRFLTPLCPDEFIYALCCHIETFENYISKRLSVKLLLMFSMISVAIGSPLWTQSIQHMDSSFDVVSDHQLNEFTLLYFASSFFELAIAIQHYSIVESYDFNFPVDLTSKYHTYSLSWFYLGKKFFNKAISLSIQPTDPTTALSNKVQSSVSDTSSLIHTTPRRLHLPQSTPLHTISEDMNQHRLNTTKSRAYGDTAILLLDTLYYLNRPSEFNEFCDTLSSHITHIQHQTSSVTILHSPWSLRTSAVIKLCLILSRYHQRFSPKKEYSIICGTEALSECNYLLYINEAGYKPSSTTHLHLPLNTNDITKENITLGPPVTPKISTTLWDIHSFNELMSMGYDFKHDHTELFDEMPIDVLYQDWINYIDYFYLHTKHSESRHLLKMMSLSIESHINVAYLWQSIGAFKLSSDLLLSLLSKGFNRLRPPLMYLSVVSYFFYNELQRLPSDHDNLSLNTADAIPFSMPLYTILKLLITILSFYQQNKQFNRRLIPLFKECQQCRSHTDYLYHSPSRIMLYAPGYITHPIPIHPVYTVLQEIMTRICHGLKCLEMMDKRKVALFLLKIKKVDFCSIPHLIYEILHYSLTRLAYTLTQEKEHVSEMMTSSMIPQKNKRQLMTTLTVDTTTQLTEDIIKLFLFIQTMTQETIIHIQSFDIVLHQYLNQLNAFIDNLIHFPKNQMVLLMIHPIPEYIVLICNLFLTLILIQFSKYSGACVYYHPLLSMTVIGLQTVIHYDLSHLMMSLSDKNKINRTLIAIQLFFMNLLSQHYRFLSLYNYKHLQKKQIQRLNSETLPLEPVIIDTAEYVLHHHHTGTTESTDSSFYSWDKYPWDWSCIINDIETSSELRRYKFWRFIPQHIVSLIHQGITEAMNSDPSLKNCYKNYSETISHWDVIITQWTTIHEWTEAEHNLKQYHLTNVDSICQNNQLDLNPSMNTNEQKIKEWWNQRFHAENVLIEWKHSIELKLLYPVISWLFGWPQCLYTDTSMSHIFSYTAMSCLNWFFHHVYLKDNHFIHFHLLFKLSHLAIRTAYDTYHETNPVTADILRQSVYLNYIIYTNDKLLPEFLKKEEITDTILWESFVLGPIQSLITQFFSQSVIIKPIQQHLTLESKKVISTRQCRTRQQQKKKKNFTDTSNTLHTIQNNTDHVIQYSPVILFLNSTDLFSYQIPWDSLPSLYNEHISIGVDSNVFHHLFNQWDHKNILNPNYASKYCIINPSGDMPESKKAIPSEWLNELTTTSISDQNNIHSFGYVDCIPEVNEVLRHWGTDDLYLYCGHQGGCQYIQRDLIHTGFTSSLQSDTALRGTKLKIISLLMGCSSIKYESTTNGKSHEVDSLALDFLIGGSPAVLGLLWDVTNLDLDRLTLETITSWLNIWNIESEKKYSKNHIQNTSAWGRLLYAKKQGVKICYLKNITGGACIHIGLPL